MSFGAFHPKDGGSILFSQNVGGSEDDQIFTKDLATGDVRRLTDGKAKYSSPEWSHDGKRVAYISYATSELHPEVCVMPVDDPSLARTVFKAPRVGWH
ncbi:MAG: hypothetical protein GWO24_00005, partial [Akkermansiaceae bacterium]|nr:hypothetical protein [Akkermansiaceae bacterium]